MRSPGRTSNSTWLLLTFVLVGALACASPPAEEKVESPSHSVVFVHGAWGGGWQYTRVQPLLEEEGYRVFRPTMTGLGERVHLAGPEIGQS
jgi:pimeloyl-ACP methyl ester carboxylesterase